MLDDLRERFQLDDINHEDRSYSTLGGLMMDQLNKVPRVGDYFIEWGYRFEVVDMDGHRVDKVWLIPMSDQKIEFEEKA